MTDERSSPSPAPSGPGGLAPIEPVLTDAALRSVVDAAPDGIVVVDETGTVVFVNPMVEQMFEYDRDELVGSSVDRLVPIEAERAHASYRTSYIEHPRTRVMGSGLDLQGRTRAGKEFPVEISLSPITNGERTLVIAIVRDISGISASGGAPALSKRSDAARCSVTT